ncbi:MAG: hypothetical protein AAB664_04445, partial [Patescibacteria group bacterium]
EGADVIMIDVYDERQNFVTHVRAMDDKNTSVNAQVSPMKTLVVSVPNLSEGVYKIDVRAPRDLFTRSITTTQQKMIFLNGVYFGDENGYQESFSPVTFFTEAKRLSAKIRHGNSAQQIKVGSEIWSITTPFQFMTTKVLDPGLVSVTIQKGDVELTSDGPLAFSASQYFRPDAVRLFPHTDLERLGIHYVLAKYTTPEIENGWVKAKIQVNARDILLDRNSWKFTFSMPEITEYPSAFFVREIDFMLKK